MIGFHSPLPAPPVFCLCSPRSRPSLAAPARPPRRVRSPAPPDVLLTSPRTTAPARSQPRPRTVPRPAGAVANTKLDREPPLAWVQYIQPCLAASTPSPTTAPPTPRTILPRPTPPRPRTRLTNTRPILPREAPASMPRMGDQTSPPLRLHFRACSTTQNTTRSSTIRASRIPLTPFRTPTRPPTSAITSGRIRSQSRTARQRVLATPAWMWVPRGTILAHYHTPHRPRDPLTCTMRHQARHLLPLALPGPVARAGTSRASSSRPTSR